MRHSSRENLLLILWCKNYYTAATPSPSIHRNAKEKGKESNHYMAKLLNSSCSILSAALGLFITSPIMFEPGRKSVLKTGSPAPSY
ncbi:hypothetical protein BDZ91DRAFT_731304 [Kalaharituber pfeilii]|nr:hypothetical protein BDZ91DRAFT_731304 [Kalaharituber pfeilii]